MDRCEITYTENNEQKVIEFICKVIYHKDGLEANEDGIPYTDAFGVKKVLKIGQTLVKSWKGLHLAEHHMAYYCPKCHYKLSMEQWNRSWINYECPKCYSTHISDFLLR